VSGQTRIERLESVGVRIPDGQYETVGGYVMDRLGRIPKRGDQIEATGFRLTVRRMDRRRVREVELTAVTPPSHDT
jgi:putative hemolysin